MKCQRLGGEGIVAQCEPAAQAKMGLPARIRRAEASVAGIRDVALTKLGHSPLFGAHELDDGRCPLDHAQAR